MKIFNAGVGGFCWKPEKSRDGRHIFLMPLLANGYCILLIFTVFKKESGNVRN